MQPNNLGDADRTRTSPKSRTHAIGPSVSDWTHQPSIPLTTEPQFAPIEILLPSHMQQIYRLHPCKSKEMSAATNEKRGTTREDLWLMSCKCPPEDRTRDAADKGSVEGVG